MPQRPGPSAPPTTRPPNPPGDPHTAFTEGLRVTSEVAYACLNAVAAIAAQVDATEVRHDGSGAVATAELSPEALRLTVGQLREAVLPAGFAGLEPDLYARAEPVRIPGLRSQPEGKRAAVYATSYHAAVVALGCGLYHRLAEEGLAYWTDPNTPGRIDLREYFDTNGAIEFAAVPAYRDFPVKRWPPRLGRAVVAGAVAADPVVNVARLSAELQLEMRRADEQHLLRVRRQAEATHAGILGAAEELERGFTAAITEYGPGHTLTVCVYPFDAMPPNAERLTFDRISIPPDGWPEGSVELVPLGHASLADHTGGLNNLLYVLFSDDRTPHGRRAAEVFVGLARYAGAFCYRATHSTAAGPASLAELVWLNTLYAYLKGTDAVQDRAGHSRVRHPFAASLRLLGQMVRGDQNGQHPPWYGSLRPGLPGSDLDGLVIEARVPTPDELASERSSGHGGTEAEPDATAVQPPARRSGGPKTLAERAALNEPQAVAKWNVYRRINRECGKPADVLERLKADDGFRQECGQAGVKLGSRLIRAAKQYFRDNPADNSAG